MSDAPLSAFTVEYTDYFANSNEEDEFESAYDSIDIHDFKFVVEHSTFTYPCPCGDLFTIAMDELLAGETMARCPSCSLVVQVVFEPADLARYRSME